MQPSLVLHRRLLLWWLVLLLCRCRAWFDRQYSAKESSRSSGRHRRLSSGGSCRRARSDLGTAHRPLFALLAGGGLPRSASESSEEVRVESPPSTAGRSLTGGTLSMSRTASAGDRSSRSGSSGWRPRSSAVADRSRTGIGGLRFLLLRERSTSTTFVPLRPWTSTGMVLSGQSWPSSRPSVAWWNWQASPLLVA